MSFCLYFCCLYICTSCISAVLIFVLLLSLYLKSIIGFKIMIQNNFTKKIWKKRSDTVTEKSEKVNNNKRVKKSIQIRGRVNVCGILFHPTSTTMSIKKRKED
uniref:Uncharacterized protein n=1 Tax=Cacopsylla melanoneura TaxID=428564 RepID=A0A8D8WQH1_9HEMI